MTIENSTSKSFDFIANHDVTRDVVLMVMYGMTSLLAIVGNVFVCETIYRKKRLASTTYALIFSMAISDVLAGLVIPGQWLFCSTAMLDGDRFGCEIACATMKMGQVLSYYVSSWTMTAIAYDRYCLICKPMSRRIQVRYLLAIVWLIGLGAITFCFINLRVSEYFPPQGIMTCRVIFKRNIGSTFGRIRTIASTITQFLLPLGVTVMLYTFVMRRIWSQKPIGVEFASDAAEKRRKALEEKKRKTTNIMIIVMVSFALSNLPAHIFYEFKHHGKIGAITNDSCFSSTFYMLCYWIAISSCVLNPFIYCIFNAEFRHEARRYWRIVTCVGTKMDIAADDNHSDFDASSSNSKPLASLLSDSWQKDGASITTVS